MPSLYPRAVALNWLIASLILVVLPHVTRLVIWVLPVFFLLLHWRFLLTRYQKPLPNRSVRMIIALAILAAVAMSYGTLLGRDAGVALLITLCGLKMMEMTHQRDALLLCFLAYFLIITNFLYSQSIPTALYMIAVMVVTTVTLISLSDTNAQLSARQRLRLATTILIQALPLMVVFFVLFPRVSGSFWNLPEKLHEGVTGLSNSLSLGNISELTLSDEIAFRVKFQGEIPPPEQRYWRGPVLWWTDGRDWKSSYKQELIADTLDFEPQGKAYQYTVTLEPHDQTWLFALDIPDRNWLENSRFSKEIGDKVPGGLNQDFQLISKHPVRQRIRYTVRSYTNYKADASTPHNTLSQLALKLPKGKHVKAIALAQQWRQQHRSPRDIVQQALDYFHQENFYYTLTPPLLLNDAIDEFLFNTRQGFCEHYAASFTVLMRAAGIPARIVTGYLGGNINSLGEYLVVRQRDAHAWSEVWLEGEGWVRIDPTSAVAPERIVNGMDTALPPLFSPLGFETELDENSFIVQIWQQFQEGWDFLDNGWNQWILGYDKARQSQLLDYFGLKEIDWQGMTFILVTLAIIVLLLNAIWIFLRASRLSTDQAQRLYFRFCIKLSRRRGLHRLPSEGPITFAKRISELHPDLSDSAHRIIQTYTEIRYRGQLGLLPQLKNLIRKFHP